MRQRRHDAAAPVPPLAHTVQRRVRFEEVDPLNIMWHGRYASWLEDGREELGRAYGIHYLDFYEHGVAIPLKLFHLEYCRPLHYGQHYTVHTLLAWSEAALLDMEYRITDDAGTLMTKGFTTQLMLGLDGQLLLEQPEFFRHFRAAWEAGNLDVKT